MSEDKRCGWIVVQSHIVGNLESWGYCYDWDGRLHETKAAAVKEGWRSLDHDDFNLGRVEDGTLVWWGWMDDEHPAEDRVGPATDLGFAVAARSAVAGPSL